MDNDQERQFCRVCGTSPCSCDPLTDAWTLGVIAGSSAELTEEEWATVREDGPRALDAVLTPLSGEWAGESLAELGLAEADQDFLDEWEGAWLSGWRGAVAARAAVEEP